MSKASYAYAYEALCMYAVSCGVPTFEQFKNWCHVHVKNKRVSDNLVSLESNRMVFLKMVKEALDLSISLGINQHNQLKYIGHIADDVEYGDIGIFTDTGNISVDVKYRKGCDFSSLKPEVFYGCFGLGHLNKSTIISSVYGDAVGYEYLKQYDNIILNSSQEQLKSCFYYILKVDKIVSNTVKYDKYLYVAHGGKIFLTIPKNVDDYERFMKNVDVSISSNGVHNRNKYRYTLKCSYNGQCFISLVVDIRSKSGQTDPSMCCVTRAPEKREVNSDVWNNLYKYS